MTNLDYIYLFTNNLNQIKCENMRKRAALPKRQKMTVSKYINRKIKTKLQNKENLDNYKSRKYFLESLEQKNSIVSGWANTRGYDSYNLDFKILTLSKKTKKPVNISDFLVEKYKQTKQPLQILDDGAGQGNFLAEIKKMMQEKGIPTKTTAVSLSDKIATKNKTYIDRNVVGDAINLNLNIKYDLITSYFGSISYSIPTLRNDIMKKYIFSLNKNGIALFRFSEIKNEPGAKSLKWTKLLEKVGFSVTEFVESPIDNKTNRILLIQRLK